MRYARLRDADYLRGALDYEQSLRVRRDDELKELGRLKVQLQEALAEEKTLREMAEKQRDALRRELDEMAAPPPVPAESDPPRIWTRQDAFSRVAIAQIGCLDPMRVSLVYLEALREFLYSWVAEIEGAITRKERALAAVEYEPEDHSDDPCPCGDPDCSRIFGHSEYSEEVSQ